MTLHNDRSTYSGDISQLLRRLNPHCTTTLIAHFQPALLARFQTLVYRPLDVVALGAIVRLKLGKVAGRLKRQHGVDQHVLPTVSRELLTRMADGTTPTKIVLSSSTEGSLTMDFVDRPEPAAVTSEATSS